MRVVIQRVTRGSVTVNEEIVGSINQGYVIFVGVTDGDTETVAKWLAKKVAGLRIFTDDDGKFNLSLLDVGGEALVVSQFTLYGDASRGRRPSFTNAARPDTAEPLVDKFAQYLRDEGVSKVDTGVFGANMHVDIQNDGPVTMMIDRDAD